MYKVIAGEGYDQKIAPLFYRIFDDYIWCWYDRPFVNQVWESVIIPGEICSSCIENIRREVKEYELSAKNIYRGIIHLIDSIENNSVYVASVPFSRSEYKNTHNAPLFGASVNVRSFMGNFSELKKSEKDFCPWFAICDETETWGYANHIDGFSFLGGTPEFMGRFYDLCGGRDVVRQTFHAYDVSTDWPFSFRDCEAPAWRRSFEDPDALVTETLRERVYHSVGWEATPYTEEEIRNSYAD